MFASEPGQKPLTKREREVLNFISEGCSNKEGALRMRISPRTFESHRAEAMRKLGARNTADLSAPRCCIRAARNAVLRGAPAVRRAGRDHAPDGFSSGFST